MDEPIRVTCQACNHVIKAPRTAAGRRGKCPHCKNEVYVPTPVDELEDIPLAPLDPAEASGSQAMSQEEQDIAAALRREVGAEEPADSRPPRPGARAVPPQSPAQISEAIIRFLLAMQASDLPKAERIASELRSNAAQARRRIQQMMVDAMPPHEVRDMPGGLYQGFLRKLQDDLPDER